MIWKRFPVAASTALASSLPRYGEPSPLGSAPCLFQNEAPLLVYLALKSMLISFFREISLDSSAECGEGDFCPEEPPFATTLFKSLRQASKMQHYLYGRFSPSLLLTVDWILIGIYLRSVDVSHDTPSDEGFQRWRLPTPSRQNSIRITPQTVAPLWHEYYTLRYTAPGTITKRRFLRDFLQTWYY